MVVKSLDVQIYASGISILKFRDIEAFCFIVIRLRIHRNCGDFYDTRL